MLKYLVIGGVIVIIQAHCKGLFNCELGIVDSISIRRGGNSTDMFTIDNLPMEVDVTLSVKDLYSALSITKMDNMEVFANNIGLIDFVSVLCGVSVSKPDIMRKFDILFESKLNKIRDIPGNVKSNISDTTRDFIRKIAGFGD